MNRTIIWLEGGEICPVVAGSRLTVRNKAGVRSESLSKGWRVLPGHLPKKKRWHWPHHCVLHRSNCPTEERHDEPEERWNSSTALLNEQGRAALYLLHINQHTTSDKNRQPLPLSCVTAPFFFCPLLFQTVAGLLFSTKKTSRYYFLPSHWINWHAMPGQQMIVLLFFGVLQLLTYFACGRIPIPIPVPVPYQSCAPLLPSGCARKTEDRGQETIDLNLASTVFVDTFTQLDRLYIV